MPIPKVKVRALHQKTRLSAKWRDIEGRLDKLGGVWRFDDPLRLNDLKAFKYLETGEFLYVLARLEKPKECLCGSSAESMKKNGSTEVLRIMDLPIHKKKVVIFYIAQRYLCSGCGKSAQSMSDEVHDSHRMTERLFKYVREESLSFQRTFISVEDEVGVDNLVVRNIHSDYVRELQSQRVVEHSVWIAIDEVYPTSRKEPRCVISAPLENRVLDILVDNSAAKTLGPFLLQIKDRHKIQVVSMDIFNPYRAIVKQVLPNAKIVGDFFHVAKIINEALKQVFSVMRLTLTEAERKKYLCKESKLLMCGLGAKGAKEAGGYSKISDNEKEKLRLTFEKVPDLETAYNLKEEFNWIFSLSDIDEAESRARSWLDKVGEFAKYFYNKYKKECHSVGKKPFESVVYTMNSWFDEILNYIRIGDQFGKKITNAYAENINRKIKELNRLGYGYHFEILRSKIVFGGIKRKHSDDPMKIPKNRKPRVKRKPQVDGESKAVNPNSNVSRIVETCEETDPMLDLISNPMLNEDYAKRSPLVIDESPRKTDRRGIPVRESRRTRIKVKVRDRQSSQFDEESSVGTASPPDQADGKVVFREQISMFPEGLEEKIPHGTSRGLPINGEAGNSSDLCLEECRSNKSVPKSNAQQSSSFPLFDFLSESRPSHDRV